MTEPLLELDRISGGYGSGLIVREVSLSVGRGEAICLLGRNGVGKSTLVKLACGFLRPASGAVRLEGQEITGRPPSYNVGAGLTYCPQERIVFDDLTVAENLTLMRKTRKLDDFDRYFHVFPRLFERRRQHGGTLSGGEKKILSFVRGLAEGASMVMLDEPTEGVQFENVARVAHLIQSHKMAGTSFLVVEQNLTLVECIADRIVIMDHGELVYRCDAAEFSRQEILTYLTV